jgi:hypothetical protein
MNPKQESSTFSPRNGSVTNELSFVFLPFKIFLDLIYGSFSKGSTLLGRAPHPGKGLLPRNTGGFSGLAIRDALSPQAIIICGLMLEGKSNSLDNDNTMY